MSKNERCLHWIRISDIEQERCDRLSYGDDFCTDHTPEALAANEAAMDAFSREQREERKREASLELSDQRKLAAFPKMLEALKFYAEVGTYNDFPADHYYDAPIMLDDNHGDKARAAVALAEEAL